MMLYKSLAIIATVIATVAVGFAYTDSNRIAYTCSADAYTRFDFPGMLLTGRLNAVLSMSRSNRMYANAGGNLNVNGTPFHLSREIAWQYETTNLELGLMKITPLYENSNASDNIEGREVGIFVLGKEQNGRLIRHWRLHNNIVLIGNPLGPIYGCVLLN